MIIKLIKRLLNIKSPSNLPKQQIDIDKIFSESNKERGINDRQRQTNNC